jgi:hypothetical protein
LEEVGTYGIIILKRIFKKWDGGVDWIDLAEDRKRWHPFVRLQIPYNERNFVTRSRPISISRWTLLHGVTYLMSQNLSKFAFKIEKFGRACIFIQFIYSFRKYIKE